MDSANGAEKGDLSSQKIIVESLKWCLLMAESPSFERILWCIVRGTKPCGLPMGRRRRPTIFPCGLWSHILFL